MNREKYLKSASFKKKMNLTANNLYRLFATLLLVFAIVAYFLGEEKLTVYCVMAAFLLLFFKREIFDLFNDLFGAQHDPSARRST